MKEKLGWSPGESWSMEQYGKTVPWGHHRLAKRSFWIFCHLHRALRSDPPQVDVAKGIVAQALKFYVQTALDHGAADAATTLLPWEDPISSQTRNAAPPDLAGSDPFSGLAEAHEIAIAMAWIRDNTAFSKARLERLGQGGKGSGKGKEAEAGPSKPDWKKLKEQKKEAKAKSAAAKASAEKK